MLYYTKPIDVGYYGFGYAQTVCIRDWIAW